MKILSYTFILSAYFLSVVSSSNNNCDFEYGYAYDIGHDNRICVDCNNANDWFPRIDFTYQLWIKPQVLTSERIQQIFGNLYYIYGTYYNHGILIANRTLYFHTGRATQNLTKENSLGYDLTNHYFKWTHVSATFENKLSDQIGKLYINGELVAMKNNMGATMRHESYVQIGSTSDHLFYTGLVDEVRFFNRVFDEEEVQNTWNKVLPQEYINESLLLYFNADGEEYNSPKDKSTYNRPAEWKSDPQAGSLARNFNVIADCMGCFSCDMTSFCVPNENNTGKCGDRIVMGDEECDGGDGCDDNCKCKEGYTAHDLPYCKKNVEGAKNSECPVSVALKECIGAMSPDKCDCECFKKLGIDCLLRLGCDSDNVPYRLLGLWDLCLERCPSNYYCYEVVPDYCVRLNTSNNCKRSGCTWCGGICVSMKTSCPVVNITCADNSASGLESNIVLLFVSIVVLFYFYFFLQI